MAQKVNIILVDDLDQSDAEETVSFGLDGATYAIDLSGANATALREALAPYVAAARKESGARRAARKVAVSGPNPREVRDWARSNGHEVSDRGRVPAEVIAAFEAAH